MTLTVCCGGGVDDTLNDPIAAPLEIIEAPSAQICLDGLMRSGSRPVSLSVQFAHRDGTPRPGPIDVDFGRVLAADSLLDDPPASVSPSLSLLGWLDELLDWTSRILPFTPNPL